MSFAFVFMTLIVLLILDNQQKHWFDWLEFNHHKEHHFLYFYIIDW